MFKKLLAQDLRPGMYIADSSRLSPDNPFLYATEGLITSMQQVDEMISQGYKEAVIDLDLSYREWAEKYSSSEELFRAVVLRKTPDSPPLPPPPVTSLAEELPKASALYTQALVSTKRIIQDFRTNGKLDVQAGSVVVEEIMGSVLRNVNALQVIGKLHNQDDYTFSHCINVAMLTVMIARHLGNTGDALFEAGMAGFFHDLGKAQVPPAVLNAPRRLSPREFQLIQRHPEIGYEQLQKFAEHISSNVCLAALEHHERIDGSGYPAGKTEDKISYLGKLIAIVDVYDALSSQRVYKNAVLSHKVLGLLYDMRNTALHAEMTEHFICCMGIYPSGSVVKISSGEICVVTQTNSQLPLRPQVLAVRDARGFPVRAKAIDLAVYNDLFIVQCLEPGSYGIYPERILRSKSRTA